MDHSRGGMIHCFSERLRNDLARRGASFGRWRDISCLKAHPQRRWVRLRRRQHRQPGVNVLEGGSDRLAVFPRDEIEACGAANGQCRSEPSPVETWLAGNGWQTRQNPRTFLHGGRELRCFDVIQPEQPNHTRIQCFMPLPQPFHGTREFSRQNNQQCQLRRRQRAIGSRAAGQRPKPGRPPRPPPPLRPSAPPSLPASTAGAQPALRSRHPEGILELGRPEGPSFSQRARLDHAPQAGSD
jgi:hypothetical protein